VGASAQALRLPSASHGWRYAAFHPAQRGDAKACVLYVHPLAEEMNKSRRMAALQARALAAAGADVLLLDLLGCGDSGGDFGDAGWSQWIDDLRMACAWLQARSAGPLWLWGLRAGCLLAAAAAKQLDSRCNLLFWQPTPSGKLVVQQFLRLRLAGEMLGGAGKAAMEGLRKQLADGEAVDIAGYRLNAALAQALEHSSLPPPQAGGRLEWIELSSQAEGELLPASQPVVDRWLTASWAVQTQLVRGPAFWQTTEIEEAPALLDASVRAVLGPSP
jgi:exosortase A-associated hydrolase 2